MSVGAAQERFRLENNFPRTALSWQQQQADPDSDPGEDRQKQAKVEHGKTLCRRDMW